MRNSRRFMEQLQENKVWLNIKVDNYIEENFDSNNNT